MMRTGPMPACGRALDYEWERPAWRIYMQRGDEEQDPDYGGNDRSGWRVGSRRGSQRQ